MPAGAALGGRLSRGRAQVERSQVTQEIPALNRASCIASLAFLGFFGCSASRHAWSEADDPGDLHAAEALTTEGAWHQHVSLRWDESDARTFDTVLRRQESSLAVHGLTPEGSVGFAIVLEDGGIEVTNHTGDELPIPPRLILLDVQRSFYPWLPASAAFGIDGRYEGEVGGEYVTEVRRGGRLQERVFRRLDGDPEGEIRIRYTWGRDEWSVPSSVVLDNGWFDYRLRIETREETLLRGA